MQFGNHWVLQWSLLLIVRSDTKGRSYTDGIIELMIMSFDRWNKGSGFFAMPQKYNQCHIGSSAFSECHLLHV